MWSDQSKVTVVDGETARYACYGSGNQNAMRATLNYPGNPTVSRMRATLNYPGNPTVSRRGVAVGITVNPLLSSNRVMNSMIGRLF